MRTIVQRFALNYVNDECYVTLGLHSTDAELPTLGILHQNSRVLWTVCGLWVVLNEFASNKPLRLRKMGRVCIMDHPVNFWWLSNFPLVARQLDSRRSTVSLRELELWALSHQSCWRIHWPEISTETYRFQNAFDVPAWRRRKKSIHFDGEMKSDYVDVVQNRCCASCCCLATMWSPEVARIFCPSYPISHFDNICRFISQKEDSLGVPSISAHPARFSVRQPPRRLIDNLHFMVRLIVSHPSKSYLYEKFVHVNTARRQVLKGASDLQEEI